MLIPLENMQQSKYGSLHDKLNVSVIIDAKKKKELRSFNEHARSLNIRIKRNQKRDESL